MSEKKRYKLTFWFIDGTTIDITTNLYHRPDLMGGMVTVMDYSSSRYQVINMRNVKFVDIDEVKVGEEE